LISRFFLGSPIGFWTLFLYCFVLAVPGDIMLCWVAAGVARRLRPWFRPVG
jgi:biotin transport system substrate-specific component